MTIQTPPEFPLIHQIAFTSRPDLYTPNKYSLEIKRQFGKENYRLWDLDNAREFLSAHYSKDVVHAFDSLKPYAFKSDLVRYCILNTFGGTYADISMNKLKTFSNKNYDMVIFRDGNSDRTSWKVSNGLFYSKPNNPVLKECIENIVSNVRNRYYGHDAHFIGGPSVFGRAIAKYGTEIDFLIGQYWWFEYRKNKYTLPEGQVIARHKRGGAKKGGISGIIGGNNYNEFWAARKVYGEVNEN